MMASGHYADDIIAKLIKNFREMHRYKVAFNEIEPHSLTHIMISIIFRAHIILFFLLDLIAVE